MSTTLKPYTLAEMHQLAVDDVWGPQSTAVVAERERIAATIEALDAAQARVKELEAAHGEALARVQKVRDLCDYFSTNGEVMIFKLLDAIAPPKVDFTQERCANAAKREDLGELVDSLKGQLANARADNQTLAQRDIDNRKALTESRAEVERLRTRETKAVVALTSIKNRLTKGPMEFAGWSVVAEQARREAESALAEWEKP